MINYHELISECNKKINKTLRDINFCVRHDEICKRKILDFNNQINNLLKADYLDYDKLNDLTNDINMHKSYNLLINQNKEAAEKFVTFLNKNKFDLETIYNNTDLPEKIKQEKYIEIFNQIEFAEKIWYKEDNYTLFL